MSTALLYTCQTTTSSRLQILCTCPNEYEPPLINFSCIKEYICSLLEVWFLLEINPVPHVQKLTPNLIRILSKYTNFEVQHSRKCSKRFCREIKSHFQYFQRTNQAMKLPEIFTIYKIFDILNVPKYNQSACNSYLAQLKLT